MIPYQFEVEFPTPHDSYRIGPETLGEYMTPSSIESHYRTPMDNYRRGPVLTPLRNIKFQGGQPNQYYGTGVVDHTSTKNYPSSLISPRVSP